MIREQIEISLMVLSLILVGMVPSILLTLDVAFLPRRVLVEMFLSVFFILLIFVPLVGYYLAIIIDGELDVRDEQKKGDV